MPYTQVDMEEVNACPLCDQYEFIELEDTMPGPDNQPIMASVYASCCHIQVSADTLQQAIEKWNDLSCDCMEEV